MTHLDGADYDDQAEDHNAVRPTAMDAVLASGSGIGLRIWRPMSRGLIPGSVDTGCGAHPTSYSVVTRGFPWDKAVEP